MKKLFMAATGQHVGKTTCTLGLIHSLREQGLNVGYCKPVGQQFIDVGASRADKDALLFASSMGFELVPQLHSPVILGHGATTAYLDNPERYNFANKVLKASKILHQNHQVIVYEGTGHTGVGSVVNLSNDRVAEMLEAGVIMVVEAGIGNTIDRLYLALGPFERRGIPIVGVIINKAMPDKIEKVQHYVGRVLRERGIPLLGILPYEEELGLPVMHTIAQTLHAQVMFNEQQLDNKVRGIIAGSLIDLNEMKTPNNQLLVVSINRFGEAIRKLTQVTRQIDQKDCILSGIILTGRGEISGEQVEFIEKNKVPVLRAKLDTYESVIKISKIEVKINTRTPWKVKKAIELFRNHVDLTPVMEQIKASS
jgi:hypothetical protein